MSAKAASEGRGCPEAWQPPHSPAWAWDLPGEVAATRLGSVGLAGNGSSPGGSIGPPILLAAHMQTSDLGRGAKVPGTLRMLSQVGGTCSRNQGIFVERERERVGEGGKERTCKQVGRLFNIFF